MVKFDEIWKTSRRSKYQDLFRRGNHRKSLTQKINALNRKRISERRVYEIFEQRFDPNRRFPDLSSSATIERRVNFGRSIFATSNIEPSTKIGEVVPFVSVIDKTNQIYCLTCQAINMQNFIRCEVCRDVVFCNVTCQDRNDTHVLECGTVFQYLEFGDESIDIKCAIQLVLKALIIYNRDVGSLQEAIEELLDGNYNIRQQIPSRIESIQSRFKTIMRLHTIPDHLREAEIEFAYNLIMSFPMVNERFQWENDQSFLKILLAHSILVIKANGFSTCRNGEKEWTDTARRILYDSVSFFNHSCSPNVINALRGNRMILISSRGIVAGEQLCISYTEFDLDQSKNLTLTNTEQRRKYLRDNWGFDCECERCTNEEPIKKKMVNDCFTKKKRTNAVSLRRTFQTLETKVKEECAIPADGTQLKWKPKIGALCLIYYWVCTKSAPLNAPVDDDDDDDE